MTTDYFPQIVCTMARVLAFQKDLDKAVQGLSLNFPINKKQIEAL